MTSNEFIEYTKDYTETDFAIFFDKHRLSYIYLSRPEEFSERLNALNLQELLKQDLADKLEKENRIARQKPENYFWPICFKTIFVLVLIILLIWWVFK